jgi:hypothetical protein
MVQLSSLFKLFYSQIPSLARPFQQIGLLQLVFSVDHLFFRFFEASCLRKQGKPDRVEVG